MCWFANCLSTLKWLVKSFDHCWKQVVVIEFWESFIYFGSESFIRWMICQYFHSVCISLYILLSHVFWRTKVLNICSQASWWVVYTHSLPLDLGWSAVFSWPSCTAPPHIALTHLTLRPVDGAVFRPHLSVWPCSSWDLTRCSPGTLLPLSYLCDHSFLVSFFYWAVLPRKCPLTPHTCSSWWDLPLHLSHDHFKPVTHRSPSAAQPPRQLGTHSPSSALQLL